MLNSTKTWQEWFKLKLYNVYATVFQLSKYDNQQLKEKADVMVQFISDLRKKDKEELIKMIKEKEQDLTNLTENNDIWKSLGDDARLHNLALGMCERLIKEYYQNN